LQADHCPCVFVTGVGLVYRGCLADAVLIRPDACIAWAAATGEPAGAAGPALREALSGWLGAPRKTTVPETA
jgi:aromatic ring hydroxylase-like protein